MAQAWHRLGAAGATTHAWFTLWGPRGIELFEDRVPDGRELRAVLPLEGPAGHDVWFQQVVDGGGTRLTDMLWDTSVSGVTVVSDRLAALLTSMEGDVRTAPIEVRDRAGAPVPGYVAVLEPLDPAAPVHSMHRRTRGSALVVSDAVAAAVRRGRFLGVSLREVDTVFPGDQPLVGP